MHTETFNVQVKIFRLESVPGMLYKRRVLDRVESRRVRVTVDTGQIARELGERACNKKSGRARYMKGAVIVSDEG